MDGTVLGVREAGVSDLAHTSPRIHLPVAGVSGHRRRVLVVCSRCVRAGAAASSPVRRSRSSDIEGVEVVRVRRRLEAGGPGGRGRFRERLTFLSVSHWAEVTDVRVRGLLDVTAGKIRNVSKVRWRRTRDVENNLGTWRVVNTRQLLGGDVRVRDTYKNVQVFRQLFYNIKTWNGGVRRSRTRVGVWIRGVTGGVEGWSFSGSHLRASWTHTTQVFAWI